MADPPPILVATDLAPRSDRVVDRARAIAETMGCGVVLVHVLENPAASEQDLERLRAMVRHDLGDDGDAVEIRIERGSAPTVLANVAEEEDSPLIVTGTGRFNSPVDYVLGTAVDFLVRKSPVPVLVVRRRSRRAYRRLLVLTDFSLCSQTALEAADDFFGDAPIELVHVCPSDRGAPVDPQAMLAEAASEMTEFLSELEESLRSRITPIIERGDLREIVQARFLQGEYDLLVLGTRGRGAVARATIGSCAAALLAAAMSDVMMVSQHV